MSSAPAIVSSTGPPNAQAEELFCQHCKAKKTGRSLIVCLDGTSNQFGKYNTNVIELYDRIDKDETQPTYYNSGIGTYARPSFASYTYVKQVLDNTIDLAIAWNFERVVLGAYRWLSENYKPGDKIYLFGFSRGAYQVRVLAGMIHEVGLILPGNEEQIPFVYELYADLKGQKFDRSRDDDRRPLNLAQRLKRIFSQKEEDWSGDEDEGGQPLNMAQRFKRTFSQRGAAVHFLGAWDTVSSIGVVRKKNLPATDEFNHICYFRQALALDERRVKFLPEYVCGGESYEGTVEDSRACGPHVKEVWFAGCHSDIGGGSKKNTRLNNATVPVLWMGREAMIAGLKLYPSKVEWNWDELRKMKPAESLTWVWRVFEMFPFKRLSYTDRQKTTWRPHLWTGRTIKKGQKIHASVAFISNYVPRATLSGGLPIGRWEDVLEQGRQDTTEWAKGLEGLLEMDFFDFSDTKAVIELVSNDMRDTVLRRRLTFIASVRDGAAEIRRVDPALALFRKMLESANEEVVFSGIAMLVDLASPTVSLLLASDAHSTPDVTKSVPLLVQTLKNKAPRVRIRGVKALMELRYSRGLLRQCLNARAVPLLIEMSQNMDQAEDVHLVVKALHQFGANRRKWGIAIQVVRHLVTWDIDPKSYFTG
ncbi:hypothetical protein BV22DRAFT_1058171, partial [Leucogyrophana mollusca]